MLPPTKSDESITNFLVEKKGGQTIYIDILLPFYFARAGDLHNKYKIPPLRYTYCTTFSVLS